MGAEVNPDNLVSSTIADGVVFCYAVPDAYICDDASAVEQYFSDFSYPWWILTFWRKMVALQTISHYHLCDSLALFLPTY
jgi:hypothetical protein